MLDFMRKGLSPLPGDPRAYFSSLAQDDAATAVVAALGVPAGTYNIVDDVPMRREEWTRSLASAAGIPVPKTIPDVGRGARWFADAFGGAVGADLESKVPRGVRMGAEVSERGGRVAGRAAVVAGGACRLTRIFDDAPRAGAGGNDDDAEKDKTA